MGRKRKWDKARINNFSQRVHREDRNGQLAWLGDKDVHRTMEFIKVRIERKQGEITGDLNEVECGWDELHDNDIPDDASILSAPIPDEDDAEDATNENDVCQKVVDYLS